LRLERTQFFEQNFSGPTSGNDVAAMTVVGEGATL
jgi:hypothetical protein